MGLETGREAEMENVPTLTCPCCQASLRPTAPGWAAALREMAGWDRRYDGEELIARNFLEVLFDNLIVLPPRR